MCYQLTEKLPSSEDFVLKSQIKRSALSVGLNFAEGWGRRSQKEFKRFLKISEGSLIELAAAIEILKELYPQLVSLAEPICGKINEVGYLLFKFKVGVASRASRTSPTFRT